MRIECTDIGVDYCGPGPWRNYELMAYGDTVEACLEDATISEIDQDGGELRTYGFDEAGNDVADAVERIIKDAFNPTEPETPEAA